MDVELAAQKSRFTIGGREVVEDESDEEEEDEDGDDLDGSDADLSPDPFELLEKKPGGKGGSFFLLIDNW